MMVREIAADRGGSAAEQLSVATHAPNHVQLGERLRLFQDGPQLPGPLWLPAGVALRQRLGDWLRAAYRQAGYAEVRTPRLRQAQPRADLRDGPALWFASRRRSYRDLPWRGFELGLVARPGRERWGLLGQPEIERDEGLVLLQASGLLEELTRALTLQRRVWAALGLEPELLLCTRPPQAPATAAWEGAEAALERAALQVGLSPRRARGSATVRGPVLKVRVRDALGRRWDMGWVAVDLELPQARGLSYVSARDARRVPLAVHVGLSGSLERLVAVLLEHGGGALPGWLSPEQVRLLAVGEEQGDRVREVTEALCAAGLRAVAANERQGPLAGRVREALERRVPWVAVVGAREHAEGTVALRTGEQAQLRRLPLDVLIGELRQACQPPRIETTPVAAAADTGRVAAVAPSSSQPPQGGYRH